MNGYQIVVNRVESDFSDFGASIASTEQENNRLAHDMFVIVRDALHANDHSLVSRQDDLANYITIGLMNYFIVEFNIVQQSKRFPLLERIKLHVLDLVKTTILHSTLALANHVMYDPLASSGHNYAQYFSLL